jgi:hypothetical protein
MMSKTEKVSRSNSFILYSEALLVLFAFHKSMQLEAGGKVVYHILTLSVLQG